MLPYALGRTVGQGVSTDAGLSIPDRSVDADLARHLLAGRLRAAVDPLFREGQLLTWGIPATGVLVETLLDRSADGDVAEAEAAIERLATAPADEGLVLLEIWLLRLRALLAHA